MARFYRATIGTTHLTSTGLSGGTPCKMSITGVDALRVAFAGQTLPSADGTPQTVAFANEKRGRTLSFAILYIPKTVFDLIVTEINSAISGNSTIQLTGTGDLGNFDVQAVPSLPTPIAASGQFSNGILRDVTFNFTVADET